MLGVMLWCVFLWPAVTGLRAKSTLLVTLDTLEADGSSPEPKSLDVPEVATFEGEESEDGSSPESESTDVQVDGTEHHLNGEITTPEGEENEDGSSPDPESFDVPVDGPDHSDGEVTTPEGEENKDGSSPEPESTDVPVPVDGPDDHSNGEVTTPEGEEDEDGSSPEPESTDVPVDGPDDHSDGEVTTPEPESTDVPVDGPDDHSDGEVTTPEGEENEDGSNPEPESTDAPVDGADDHSDGEVTTPEGEENEDGSNPEPESTDVPIDGVDDHLGGDDSEVDSDLDSSDGSNPAVHSIYVLVDGHNDRLVDEVTVSGEENDASEVDRKFGRAILTVLLENVGGNPDNYHITHVQKSTSNENLRQYRYDFFDSSGTVNEETVVNCLQETGMLDKLIQAVGFPLLFVTDKENTNLEKQSIYVIVNEESDIFGDKTGPANDQQQHGKVMLTTILEQYETNTDRYYISHVQQYFSRDKTVRQYRFDFFDLKGLITRDIVARSLRKAGTADKVNQALDLTVLSLSDLEWIWQNYFYNFFKSTWNHLREYEGWTGPIQTFNLIVDYHNDFLDNEVTSLERPRIKAILCALLEKAGGDPDDYFITRVQKTFSGKNNIVRTYKISFFDYTKKITQETTANCLQAAGMLDKLNHVAGFGILQVTNEDYHGATRHAVYVIVNEKDDTLKLADEISPTKSVTEMGRANKKYGKAILTTLFAETSQNPADYYITHVEKTVSRDYSVRQYRYEFYDLTGKITEATIAECLKKTGVIDKINKILEVDVLRVTNEDWNGMRNNYFRSKEQDHKEFEEWVNLKPLSIYVMMNSGNDKWRRNQRIRILDVGKAVLMKLLEDMKYIPDDFHIHNVEMEHSIEYSVRQFRFDFYDFTHKVNKETIRNRLQLPGMFKKLNEIFGLHVIRVSDEAWDGRRSYYFYDRENNYTMHWENWERFKNGEPCLPHCFAW